MSKLFKIEDFKDITMDSKKEFDQHYAKYPVTHSEKLFSTMISWKHHTDYLYQFVGEDLLLLSKMGGQNFFRIPHGARDPEVLSTLLKMAKEHGGKRPLVAVQNDEIEWVSELYPDIKFTLNEDYFDYTYLAKNLAELEGSDYAKMRSRISKFKRRHEHEVQNVSSGNFEEVMEFMKRWCQWKNCSGDPILAEEAEALKVSMDLLFGLDLRGIVVRIGGNIEALSVFEVMNNDTAIIHYEKAMPEFDGIYQLINQESAKILAADHKYINRESDLGKAGLRTAKRRYHPHHMEEVSFVEMDDLVI